MGAVPRERSRRLKGNAEAEKGFKYTTWANFSGARLDMAKFIGSLAFEENVLSTLLDARRFLKPGGKIMPEAIELWGALADTRAHCGGWADVAGFNFCEASPPLADWKALPVLPQTLLSPPSRLARIDTRTVDSPSLALTHPFTASAAGHLGHIVLWPKIYWTAEHITDASPFSPLTHWKQAVLPITPRFITQSETLPFELRLHPHPDAPHEHTEILWHL